MTLKQNGIILYNNVIITKVIVNPVQYIISSFARPVQYRYENKMAISIAEVYVTVTGIKIHINTKRKKIVDFFKMLAFKKDMKTNRIKSVISLTIISYENKGPK
jgi:hypothetical protein